MNKQRKENKQVNCLIHSSTENIVSLLVPLKGEDGSFVLP